MPTKIRLQRHGKKRYAYFHVVIADSRAPRDGKFIEKLGTYNPNTNPATIDIDFDSALTWVKKGAQPTDTVRALLSYKGILYKNHLDKGVLKGAFTQEQADAKFEEWLEGKGQKIQAKLDGLTADADKEAQARLAGEKEANKRKADAIAAKNAELAGEVAEEAPAETATEEAPATEAATEDAPAAEAATEEAPAAEAATEEAPAAEAATEEAPATEAATEEAPAAEEKKDADKAE